MLFSLSYAALLLKNAILTMKNIKNIVSVRLVVNRKEEKLMLNFLY